MADSAKVVTGKSDLPAHLRLTRVPFVKLLIILLVIAGLIWLITTYGLDFIKGNSVRKSFTNAGYSYSVVASKDAKIQKFQNLNFLVAPAVDGKPAYDFSATSVVWPVINDCNLAGQGWKDAFSATVDGKTYKVCQSRNIYYLTVVETAGAKHLINVTSKDRKTQLNNDQVKPVIESFKASKS